MAQSIYLLKKTDILQPQVQSSESVCYTNTKRANQSQFNNWTKTRSSKYGGKGAGGGVADTGAGRCFCCGLKNHIKVNCYFRK